MFLRGLLPLLAAASPSVGGQAVMEGVMIRARDRLAIAVRRPGGDIVIEVRPWFSLTRARWLKKPMVRGFPVLMETLVNGIKALMFSTQVALEEEGEEEAGPWLLTGTIVVAVALALGLFVVLPHLLALGFQYLGVSGGLESLAFHLWDGLFKMAIFLGYVAAIALVPDIRRVFQYHGAEHKAVWAFEQGGEMTPAGIRGYSRLHPRCGTAFILFVLAVSILAHTVLVPWLVNTWAPAGIVLKQAYIIGVKLVLLVPIAAVSYEIIRLAGRFPGNRLLRFLVCPGLFLQLLTTYEPDDGQLEVAIAALKKALENES
jgi:uncharacterized protein YqhQ